MLATPIQWAKSQPGGGANENGAIYRPGHGLLDQYEGHVYFSDNIGNPLFDSSDSDTSVSSGCEE